MQGSNSLVSDSFSLLTKFSMFTDGAEMLSDELLGRVDLPHLVVVSVAITGSILLFLNILLVGCFMYRKRRQRLREGVFLHYLICGALQTPFGSLLLVVVLLFCCICDATCGLCNVTLTCFCHQFAFVFLFFFVNFSCIS